MPIQKQNPYVLVTGGCGYIGSHMAIELLKQNYSVVIIHNLINSKKNTINKISKITKKKPTFIKYDLKEKNKLNKIFEKYKFLAIFHFAGLKSVKDSIDNPLKYYEVNITITLNLLSMVKKYKIRNFIFSSSATVYDKKSKLPWSEKSRTEFSDHPYGSSKLINEKLLEYFYNKNKNFSFGILRYFNPAGVHKSYLIGEDPKSQSSNLVPNIIKYLLGKIKFISIYGNKYETKDGTAVRDYIHISDLIRGHMLAFNFILNNKGFNIWNLGSGEGYSVMDILHSFEKQLKKRIKNRKAPPRKGDLPKFWADIKKAEKELGWTPKKNFNDIAIDTINYVKKLNK